jgi:hypothetical protein
MALDTSGDFSLTLGFTGPAGTPLETSLFVNNYSGMSSNVTVNLGNGTAPLTFGVNSGNLSGGSNIPCGSIVTISGKNVTQSLNFGSKREGGLN